MRPGATLTRLALALLGLLGSAAQAQSPISGEMGGVSVGAVRAEAAQSEPGGVVTTLFQVRNESGDTLRGRASVSPPRGWNLLAGDRPLVLAPGAATVWMVSVAVPSAAAAGEHRLVLRVVETGSERPRFQDSLRITVAERPRVQLRVEGSSEFVLGGDSLLVRYTVRNLGNAPGRFALSWTTLGTLRARGDGESLGLAPGETASRTLRMGSPRRLEGSMTERVQLAVRGVGNAAADSAGVDVLVVPRPGRGGVRTMDRGLPGRVRLVGADGGMVANHAELTTSGRLGGRGPRLDAVARWVDPSTRLSTVRDELSLRVHGDHYSFQLGDAQFGRSALMGYGQSGFGVGGTYSLGALELGGSATRDRFGMAGDQQHVQAGVRLPGDTQLGVDLHNGGGREPGQAASVSGSFRPAVSTTLDLEYGVGRGPEGSGEGLSGRLRGDHSWLRYDASFDRASPGFPGSMQGVRAGALSLDLQPVKGVQLGGYVNRQDHQQEATAEDVFSRRADQMVGLRASLAGWFDVDYRQTLREGQLGRSRFDQLQQSVRVQSFQSLGRFSVQGSAEIGSYHDRVLNSARGWTDVTLSSFAHGRQGTAHAFVQMQRGSPYGSLSDATVWSTGLSATRSTRNGTLSQLLVESRGTPERAGGRVQRLEGRLEHRLRSGHSVGFHLQAAWGDRSLAPPSGMRVEYSIPLHLPIGRRALPGGAVGRIVDGETGRGVEGALIRVGNQIAVSDREGRLVFANLPSGTYRLSLLRREAFAGTAMSGDSAVTIAPVAGQPAEFRLAVARGGRVYGRVQRMVRAEARLAGMGADSLEAGGGLDNAAVVLVSAADTVRRVTDQHGSFDVGNLRPGRWTAFVERLPHPAGQLVSHDSVQFDLRPGGRQFIVLNARPAPREFRLVATGDIALVEAEPEPALPAVEASASAPAPAATETCHGGASDCAARPASASADSIATVAPSRASARFWRPVSLFPDGSRLQLGPGLAIAAPRPWLAPAASTPTGDWRQRFFAAGRSLWQRIRWLFDTPGGGRPPWPLDDRRPLAELERLLRRLRLVREPLPMSRPIAAGAPPRPPPLALAARMGFRPPRL